MAKSVESRQLLYANTSAYASVETSIAGIGVVIKAARRHTLFKQSDTRPTSDHVVAAYEAISLALREAKGMGARVVIVHTDCEPVLRQLERETTVSPGQLARHLETRSLMNQFHKADVVYVKPDENRAARELAHRAWEHGCRVRGELESQLSLPLAGA